MLTSYTYSISLDTADGGVEPYALTLSINASTISVSLSHINTGNDEIDIWFNDPISLIEEDELDLIVNAHVSSYSKEGYKEITYTVDGSVDYINYYTNITKDALLYTKSFVYLSDSLSQIVVNYPDGSTKFKDFVYDGDELESIDSDL